MSVICVNKVLNCVFLLLCRLIKSINAHPELPEKGGTSFDGFLFLTNSPKLQHV